ncbi:hypothetical protein DFH06DRAFT_1316947 [Mycena polygramma]|nr:hypothetical protein DFH06DRAFT_1316947 [Mycena polygramma]
MPPHSSPLNPNARPFPYPPPHARPPPHFAISRFASSPTRSLAPLVTPGASPHLRPPPPPSPLAPIVCDVLDRGRTNTFGPEDNLPRSGSAEARVRVASNLQWTRHRTGQPPLVRPGSVVAPQTLYTGREVRPNGQELHHAVFLNARMLIHDPVTGRPGMRNGHAVATLVAVPSDNRTWEFETAYPSGPDVRQILTNYGPATQAEVGRQRRAGRYRLNIDRQVERIANHPAGIMSTPLTPTLPPVPLPSIQQTLQSPPPNLLTPPQSRVLQMKKKSFFFTHPPGVAPLIDTSAMTHTGYAADTGHRVLQFPSSLRTRDNDGRLKRPDTPGPTFRLLTDPPVLRNEPSGSSSDVSMPPASPDEPDEPDSDPTRSTDTTTTQNNEESKVEEEPSASSANATSGSSTTHADSSTQTTSKWPVSNARLEKLRYEARRCTMSRAVPDPQKPPFVFAYKSTVGEAEESAVRVAQNKPQEGGAPAAEGLVVVGSVKNRSIPGSTMSITSTASARESPGAGPGSRGSHTHDYFSARSTSPTSSSLSEATSSEALSPILADDTLNLDGHDSLAATKDGKGSTSPDCRSTLPSPHLSPRLFNDADFDSPPSLRSISPDDEEARDESKSLVLRSRDPVTPVNKTEVDGYLARIGRSPPSPSNHTWTINRDWAQRRDLFLQNLQGAENADALAAISQLEALLERTPEILDHARMQINTYIDTDFVNQLQHPAVTSAGCKEIAERIQKAQDALDAYSPGLPDSSRAIHNITHIAVSQDRTRLRQLSDRAIAQPLMYRYAIELIVKQHLDWIQPYSELRRKGMALIYYLDDLSKRRRGTVDQTLLHQHCPIPPPYLHPHEYARLRLLKYTFERDGHSDVGRALDRLLRYRFKEADVVSHLLYAGLFDPKDVLLTSNGTFKEIARRVIRASSFRLFLFLAYNPRPQDKSQLLEISDAQGILVRHL